MNKHEKNELYTQSTEIALSGVSSLVGFAIGGPTGAVVGGVMTPTAKLAYQLVKSCSDRRKKRVVNVVEQAFIGSGKKEEDILQELLDNPEWADSIITMIQQLLYTDPELDELFSEIMSLVIKTDNDKERNRLIVFNSSIKGLNKVQVQIIRCIYNKGGSLSASDISKIVDVPELELRNAVRDLELRGMIIDDGTEPTVWVLRELGLAIAKAIDVLEVE